MDVTAFIISMGSMGGLGALFSIGLAIADKKLHVEEDPRIGLILEELPGANCGGCGYPGCGSFADNIIDGTARITACAVNSPDGIEAIAAIMGIEAGAEEKKTARVLCKGGNFEAAKKGNYIGIETCIAAHLTKGGEKLCAYGCMGFGDCVEACPFDAIHINDNGLPEVTEEKCTGCGNCAVACPRNIIEIHPLSHNLFVFCKNRDEMKYAKTVCIKACLGCGACVKGVEEGQMYLENNLPVIDYDKLGVVDKLPTAKCPNQCLVMLSNE